MPDLSTTSAPRPAAPPDPGAVPPGAQPGELPAEPATLVRIGAMTRHLLREVRDGPLDGAARARLRSIHHASLRELQAALPPELGAELDRMTFPLPDDGAPTVAELRIAQAQLIGWLEGVFHGIQLALSLQQAGAGAGLAGLRRQELPPDLPDAEGLYL